MITHLLPTSKKFMAPAALYSPETLFLCFWYPFLLDAE
jgi:hypothetical protein